MHSMSEIKEWAGEIANSYLRAKIEPTEVLVKIASSYDLQPHEIDLLATEANKAIHHAKYATATDKYFAADFPLADAKSAKERLSCGEKTASLHQGFIDPIIEVEIPDYHKMMGVEEETFDKTASVKHNIHAVMEKLGMMKVAIHDKLLWNENTIKTAELNFVKEAYHHALQSDSSDQRMKLLGTFDYVVKEAGFKGCNKTLAKFAYYLHQNGMLSNAHVKTAMDYFTKEAGCEVPAELISSKLPGQIINGTHPIYITLKTIEDGLAKKIIFENENERVDTKLKILSEKIKIL